MRAWIIDTLAGLERLKLAELPDPAPAPGEVVLDVRYAALNPADYYLAQGQYPAKPALPHVLGRDGIGTVSAVGEGVAEVKRGDAALILRSEIGVSRPGTLAERVAVPVESLVRPPAGWSEQQCAAAPLVYLTGYQALTQWGELPARSIVLVTGASGGVGVASIQLGVAMGHEPVALSRSEAKRAKLRDLGASVALDPESEWHKSLKQQLDPRRVDLAIDNIAGELFPRVIDVLGMNGKVSVVGQLAGPVPRFSTAALFFRRLRIGGVAVGTYTPPQSQSAWRAVVELMDRAKARPIVDSVFPFEQIQEAFARLKHGPMGKVLVGIGNH
ncbi:MAG TPA: zinc-binding alcohol dehydrogenase family protein [Tepidisphaeraceae bacterium]|nr:zinc-binding alcohol dehydrogenase family protein [Tepidisphaeraceae bacterium]